MPSTAARPHSQGLGGPSPIPLRDEGLLVVTDVKHPSRQSEALTPASHPLRGDRAAPDPRLAHLHRAPPSGRRPWPRESCGASGGRVPTPRSMITPAWPTTKRCPTTADPPAQRSGVRGAAAKSAELTYSKALSVMTRSTAIPWSAKIVAAGRTRSPPRRCREVASRPTDRDRGATPRPDNGPIVPRPTARSRGSTRPSSVSGPTSSSTPATPPAPPHLTTSSTATTITASTRRSAAHPSLVSTTSRPAASRLQWGNRTSRIAH
jgi:hypothetical protein